LPFLNPATPTLDLFVLDHRTDKDVTASSFYFLQGERRGYITRFLAGDLSVLSILPQYRNVDFNCLPAEAKEQLAGSLKKKGHDYVDRYLTNLATFTSELAELVFDNSQTPYDAIVAVPSSRDYLTEPYRLALVDKYGSAKTPRLTRTARWVSNSELSVPERIAELRLEPDGFLEGVDRVLIVDDVVAGGASAAAVVEFIRLNVSPAPSQFAIAAALQIG
jgi:hypothetical protein